jgi:hypothetical protein
LDLSDSSDDPARSRPATFREPANIGSRVRINVAGGTPFAALADNVWQLPDNLYPDSFVELIWAVSGIDA